MDHLYSFYAMKTLNPFTTQSRVCQLQTFVSTARAFSEYFNTYPGDTPRTITISGDSIIERETNYFTQEFSTLPTISLNSLSPVPIQIKLELKVTEPKSHPDAYIKMTITESPPISEMQAG